jgi:hypothetical protein
MRPITRVPETIAKGMATFRPLFWREAGFEHGSRYGTGLVVSPNKTLQGIDDLQGWARPAPARRAMHAGVFEAGWDDTALLQRHRAAVAGEYRGADVPSFLSLGPWGIPSVGPSAMQSAGPMTPSPTVQHYCRRWGPQWWQTARGAMGST